MARVVAPAGQPLWGRRGGAAPRADFVPVAQPTGAAPAAPAAPEAPKSQSLWRAVAAGVEFTPGYVAFLAYVFVTTTLTVPVATEAMAAATLSMLLPQRGGYRVPAVLRWMAAFGVWCAVGLSTTDYPSVVWDAVYAFLKIGVIAFVAANVLRSRAQITFFIVFSLACYAFFPARAGIFAYFLYGGSGFGGRTAWKGIFGNPNDLAALSLLPLSTCLGLFFTARNRLIRLVSLAGVGILALVVLLTQSRGALVAMCVFLVAALVTTRGKERLRLVYALGLAALVAIPLLPQSAIDRFSNILKVGTNTEQLKDADDQGSAEQRFEIWKVARTIVAENPVTGVGLGAYKLNHAVYAMRSDFLPTARGTRDPHSTYFAVAAETGVVGFVLFAGMVFSVIRYAERVRRAARRVVPEDGVMLLYLELGLLAYFVGGIWGSYEKLPPTYVHLVLIWAFAVVVERTLRERGVALR